MSLLNFINPIILKDVHARYKNEICEMTHKHNIQQKMTNSMDVSELPCHRLLLHVFSDIENVSDEV